MNGYELARGAVLSGLENKNPNANLMFYEIQMDLQGTAVTPDELDQAIAALIAEGFVRKTGLQHRQALARGPLFRERPGVASNHSVNVSGGTFTGDTQIGANNTAYKQINESDARRLIELIERLIDKPGADEKARPFLKALKEGTIDTAAKAIAEITKAVLGQG